ncbi:phospholipase-like protein [Tanacetum coccineum]
MWYAPRSPHVFIGGLYGEYLNKRSAARAAKQKDSGEFHPGLRGRQKGREAALIDDVRDLEGLCESLLTLPKEVKRLRGHIFKLESIIHDEPDIKDNTSQDVNGHVPGVFMPTNLVRQLIYGDFSSDLVVLNGFCNISQNEDEKGDCEHYKYTYSSKQEDQIIRLADQRQHDDISKMAEEAEQKIESAIQRLYDHREARLNKIAKEEKQRKFIGHMNSSTHMKLAIDRCVPKKRKYVDVMRSPYSGLSETLNVPSMEQLENQKSVLNPLMIEKCKSLKPWIEDLKRSFNRIDRIFLSHDLEEWLSRSVVGRCKFPWCNDISVDRSFWHGLCGLDDNRKGWLVDEHIELWIMYMWHTQPSDMDWAMVSSYFLPLLLQGYMAKFYANNAIYPVGWSNVEWVFIPINEPKRHWSLAMFHICSRIVTFYDSEKSNATHDKEFRPWYLKMRLAYGVPLAVDDPVQVALAYREKMIHFYFQHKMLCP